MALTSPEELKQQGHVMAGIELVVELVVTASVLNVCKQSNKQTIPRLSHHLNFHPPMGTLTNIESDKGWHEVGHDVWVIKDIGNIHGTQCLLATWH